jgi:hypothetical protein
VNEHVQVGIAFIDFLTVNSQNQPFSAGKSAGNRSKLFCSNLSDFCFKGCQKSVCIMDIYEG